MSSKLRVAMHKTREQMERTFYGYWPGRSTANLLWETLIGHCFDTDPDTIRASAYAPYLDQQGRCLVPLVGLAFQNIQVEPRLFGTRAVVARAVRLEPLEHVRITGDRKQPVRYATLACADTASPGALRHAEAKYAAMLTATDRLFRTHPLGAATNELDAIRRQHLETCPQAGHCTSTRQCCDVCIRLVLTNVGYAWIRQYAVLAALSSEAA